MTEDQVVALVHEYEALLRPDGRLILISPQEAGFRSDSTHVEFMDFARLARVSSRLGFRAERAFSFPFPRWVGATVHVQRIRRGQQKTSRLRSIRVIDSRLGRRRRTR